MSIFTLLKLNPATIMATIYKWLAIAGVGMALAIGGFFYGKHYGDEQSKVAIAQYEEKVTKLTNDLNKALEPQEMKILVKYVETVVHDHDVGVHNETAAIEDVKPVPADPNKPADNVSKYLSNGWVSTHDAAARSEEVGSSAATDATASTFTAVEALPTITDNYATCNEIRDELIGLQAWVNNYNTTVDKINAQNKKK